ncbi:MAG: DUF4251 domain-containing protein [Prolixibacteraceae bacterium]|jgi:hypothetical protein|nr:DUF4251 domain-containing protein [Prolixibacteraceae bacterium]
MERKTTQLIALLLIAIMPAISQPTNRKAAKEEKRIGKEKGIATLIDLKKFEFEAQRAIPTGFSPVDLTTNPNFVRFSPELIVSEMPFFGRAYSVQYGGEGGLKFVGEPEVFTIEKGKKYYAVEVKVKSKSDYFTINLSISFGGSATMVISSNNRSPISYYGQISEIALPEVK